MWRNFFFLGGGEISFARFLLITIKMSSTLLWTMIIFVFLSSFFLPNVPFNSFWVGKDVFCTYVYLFYSLLNKPLPSWVDPHFISWFMFLAFTFLFLIISSFILFQSKRASRVKFLFLFLDYFIPISWIFGTEKSHPSLAEIL